MGADQACLAAPDHDHRAVRAGGTVKPTDPRSSPFSSPQPRTPVTRAKALWPSRSRASRPISAVAHGAHRSGPFATAPCAGPGRSASPRRTSTRLAPAPTTPTWCHRRPACSAPAPRPACRARSAMLRSPLRRPPGGMPTPLSVTVRRTWWASASRTMSARPAWAWRATLRQGLRRGPRRHGRRSRAAPACPAGPPCACRARSPAPAPPRRPSARTRARRRGPACRPHCDRRPKIVERMILMVSSRSPTARMNALRGLGVLDEAARALQGHASGEEPLDRQVVQVPGDAVAVLERRRPARRPAGVPRAPWRRRPAPRSLAAVRSPPR